MSSMVVRMVATLFATETPVPSFLTSMGMVKAVPCMLALCTGGRMQCCRPFRRQPQPLLPILRIHSRRGSDKAAFSSQYENFP